MAKASILGALVFASAVAAHTPALAQAMGEGGAGTAERPVDIYVHSNQDGKTMRITTRMTAVGLRQMTLATPEGQPICEGELLIAGKNWAFQPLRCSTLGIQLDRVELAENFKWGMMRHSIASTKLPDGRTVGLVLHLSNETEWTTTARVPDEKFQSVYGNFPDWKLPGR